MARDDPQVNFRMPAALKRRLEQAADASGRSLTAEIIQRLEQSFTSVRVDMSREEITELVIATVDDRIEHIRQQMSSTSRKGGNR